VDKNILTGIFTYAKLTERFKDISKQKTMEQKINFERFMKVGSRFSDTISLNKAGGWTFNSGFYKKQNIAQYNCVALFFAQQNGKKIIGFSFYKKPVEGTLKVSGKNNSASVKSNSFVRSHEIDPKLYAGKYPPKEQKSNDGEKIFYIELKKKES